MDQSNGEVAFQTQWKQIGLPPMQSELYWAKPLRDYHSEYYLPQPYNMLIEIEGGTKGKSRHTSEEGYRNDLRKYNLAIMMGFRLYRFDTEMVDTGEAVAFMVTVLTRLHQELGLAPLELNGDYQQGWDGVITLRQHWAKIVREHNADTEKQGSGLELQRPKRRRSRSRTAVADAGELGQ